jgi:asparagine synthase (glutamine-hydrolysing)
VRGLVKGLAGVFDPHGGVTGGAPLRATREHLFAEGPLQVAFDGPGGCRGGLLCLLEGFLDDATELARQLSLDGEPAPEELLAAGYRRWGPGLPARLRGDFALLIWDTEHREGLLARDQLGVRGVYLHKRSGVLSFATELHELLELLPATPAPDRAALAHWLAASNRPGDGTLYEGVRRLDPGAMLLLGSGGVRRRSYWGPRYREPERIEPAEAAERVRAELERGVTRCLRRPGRVGVLMSGGLDSASVAALAAAPAGQEVSAYSGVFPEHPQVDESELIAELGRSLRLGGAQASVRAGGLVASALESARASRLPLLGWGDFWTVPLLRVARADGVTVTLGGDGGDELFGARTHLLADALRAGRPGRALRLARELPGAGEHPPRREVAGVLLRLGLAPALPRPPAPLARAAERRRLPAWLAPGAARALLDSDDGSAWRSLDGPRWWAHAAHGLTRGVEETGVFEHQRLRGRLVGVEPRHPFFDLDLLELSLTLAPELSMDRHRNRPLLRTAVAGALPESVRLRPAKAWFDSLIVDCLTGPDARAIRLLLDDRGSELAEFVERGALRERLDSVPGAGVERFRWMFELWRLVGAECWLRVLAGRADGLPELSRARVTVSRVAGGDSSVFPPRPPAGVT